MALSPDWASYRFDNLRRYQGASVHRAVAPLCPFQGYRRYLTVTCASEKPGVKMSPVQKAEPVLGKPLSTLLSSVGFIVIGSGRGLTLRPSKLSADGLGNPPNAGIEGLAAVRPVVVGRTRPLVFLFLRHADAPSSGSIG